MSPLASDRTVYASNRAAEVVRYDRAGKWYVEWRDGGRLRVNVSDAAKNALSLYEDGGAIYHGRPGGRTFYNHLAQL